MRCHSNKVPFILTLLLIGPVLWGCISFRIEKIRDGADVPRLPEEFMVGKTTLSEVLSYYGAPAEIVNMKGHFALLYQKAIYRGGHFSIGIPLGDVAKVSPSLSSMGDLLRHDTVVFVFTNEGLLDNMKYEDGTNKPLWGTFWK
jgi:hypothetical protein